MEVELHQSLLTAHPREDLVLLALCAFGRLGRHRILPQGRPAWDAWAEATLSPSLAGEVLLAWDESERRASAGARSEQVVVLPGRSARFDKTPMVLPPREALGFLGRPLRVLLENGRNDRAFILAFAEPSMLRALEEAEREGWVVFETAGGINELAERVDHHARALPSEVFRTMYLCDSDAREPGVPSEVAADIQKNLEGMAHTYHRGGSHFGAVLTWRAAENYAPPAAVRSWASTELGPQGWELIQQAQRRADRDALTNDPGPTRSSRRRFLAAVALTELPKEVRGYIDMKYGRERRNPPDPLVIRTIDAIWNKLDAFQRAALLTELPKEVCGYIDMKYGRERRNPPDPPVIRTIDAIWNKLDAFQRAVLFDGFGATFSADFFANRRGLQDETGEITALLATIMERL